MALGYRTVDRARGPEYLDQSTSAILQHSKIAHDLVPLTGHFNARWKWVSSAAANEQGKPMLADRAESHVFDLCLLDDWSARRAGLGISAAGNVPIDEFHDNDPAVDRHA